MFTPRLFNDLCPDEMDAMIISTTRFGEITVEDDRLIRMPDGLLGFEDVTAFCLIDHAPSSPFRWLQALERPELAFVVVNPFDFYADYEFDIPDNDVIQLGIINPQDVDVWTVVTISGEQVTTNLVGPIVVNRQNRQGKQLVLTNSGYGTRHALA
jgi:flagellar assembly factor FliW